jgi:uncharacterized protein (DUF58 family)
MSLRQNALFLVVVAVLLAIAGAWSADATLGRLWLLPVALLLIGLAYEAWFIARAQMRIEARNEQRAVLGRPTPLELGLAHQLARDVSVEIAPDAPQAIEIDAGIQAIAVHAGETSHLKILATPRRLGRHAWPALRMQLAGPLGLAWWPRKLPTDVVFSVMPDLLGQQAATAQSAPVGARARSMLGAGSEVLQLRDYRVGDPQHLIDWKATARRGQLVSRDFSEDQHLDIVIGVDAGRSSGLRADNLDRLGHFANLAARFAEHAILQDDRVGLVLFADRPLATIAPGRGVAAVLRIRSTLAAASVVAAESNPLNAALAIRRLVRHRSLIVLLTDLDDATVAGQLASAARLLLPKHLPFIAGLASAEVETLSTATPRDWLDPYVSLAAQEYRSRLERNTRALRALGAPALLARPAQLERAVFDAYARFRRERRV